MNTVGYEQELSAGVHRSAVTVRYVYVLIVLIVLILKRLNIEQP